MATESVATTTSASPNDIPERLHKSAYTLDGIASILESLAETCEGDRDPNATSRQVPVLIDAVQRVNKEISRIAAELERGIRQ